MTLTALLAELCVLVVAVLRVCMVDNNNGGGYESSGGHGVSNGSYGGAGGSVRCCIVNSGIREGGCVPSWCNLSQ